MFYIYYLHLYRPSTRLMFLCKHVCTKIRMTQAGSFFFSFAPPPPLNIIINIRMIKKLSGKKKNIDILNKIVTVKLLSISCIEGIAFCTSIGGIYSRVQNTACCILVLYVQYMFLNNGHNLYSIL